jgi:hypothetical protein
MLTQTLPQSVVRPGEEDERGSGRAEVIITADRVTEGDIIKNFSGVWQVITEPEYITSGIQFDVLWLGLEEYGPQTVCFRPEWRFGLLGHVGTQQVAA